MPRRPSGLSSVQFNVSENTVRESGRLLGDLCREHWLPTEADMILALEINGHPMRTLLMFVLNLRARRRTKGIWNEVLQLLCRDPSGRPRWFSLLMHEVWAVYCALRRSAAPRKPQPVFHPETATPVGRGVARQLQFHGISIPVKPKWVLSRQASQNVRQLWRRMHRRGVVMWFDNFYKPRYVYNPSRMRGTLNATVMAVLGTATMPQGHRWVDVSELAVRLQRAVDWLTQAYPKLQQRIQAVSQLSLAPADFRIPLDVPRRGVTSLPWRPFNLNDDVVQTQEHLLKILVFCHGLVSHHVCSPMPLLVDENIAYRIQKLCYAEPLQSWAVRDHLRDLPVLYGVWHPYKYVVDVVYRQFLSLWVYLLRGTVAVGDASPSKVKLRTQEMWLGAMLLLPASDRMAVHQLAVHLMKDLAIVDLRLQQLTQQWHRRQAGGVLQVTAELVDAILSEDVDPQMFTAIRDHVPQYAQVRAQHARELQQRIRQTWKARQLMHTQVLCATAMDVLLTDFAPACLVLGTMVRQCTWVRTQNGTGGHARQLLSFCLLVLVRLLEGKEHQTEYVRTLASTLLLWTDWHDSIPAAWYCEEPNEAALSRLSSLCKRHTQHVSTLEVHELWMNVTPGRLEPHDLPTGGVPQDTVTAVKRNLAEFLKARGRGVTCLPYNPQGPFNLSYAVEKWPTNFTFPDTLQRKPLAPHLRDVLQYARRSLHSQQPPSDRLMNALDLAFPRRTETEVLSDTKCLLEVISPSQIPRRYRS